MGLWDYLKDLYLPALLVLLAAVGGLLGSIIRMLDSHQKISWFVVSVEVLASAFSGVIVTLLCIALGLSMVWTGIIVGVCGWVGGRVSMTWLEKRVRKIIEGDTK